MSKKAIKFILASGCLQFMKTFGWANNVKNFLARGMFPHQMSFFLDLTVRNLLLSPQKLGSRLALKPESYVLEAGAGSGFYSVEIAGKVSEGCLVLLDIQPEMLKKARRKIEAKKLPNVGYTVADAAGFLPFTESCFDVIFLVTVLGEITNQKAFLGEARRVLKPDGILSVSEHLPDPDFLTFAKAKSLVEKEGFEYLERYGARWSYTANFRKSK